MNKAIIIIILSIFTLVLSIYSCLHPGTKTNGPKHPDQSLPDSVRLIRRGEYLVTQIGGCGDCHSPKIVKDGLLVADPQRKLSGYPADRPLPAFNLDEVRKGNIVASADLTVVAGPWGTTFAANITSDATGIGTWSFKQFETAMRKGKFKGIEEARPLMPPMPWENYSKLTHEDIQAIYSYLLSTKPVRNVVPSFIPAQ